MFSLIKFKYNMVNILNDIISVGKFELLLTIYENYSYAIGDYN